MKVKLNLLLALSHRAEMLILDEPTSGLDPFCVMNCWICSRNSKGGAWLCCFPRTSPQTSRNAPITFYISGMASSSLTVPWTISARIAAEMVKVWKMPFCAWKGVSGHDQAAEKRDTNWRHRLFPTSSSGLAWWRSFPGYPILVGSFFVCLGLFQSFQTAREANDLTYTALLPVEKRDVVRAKYAFCCFIEICYFTLTGAVTLIRMTLLSNAAVYRNNVLMNANLVYLAFVLLITGAVQRNICRRIFSDCLQICQTLCKIYYCPPLRSWGWAKRSFTSRGSLR